MTLADLRRSPHLRRQLALVGQVTAAGVDQFGRPLADPAAVRARIPGWHPRNDGDDDDDSSGDDDDSSDDDGGSDDDAQARRRQEQQRRQRGRDDSSDDDDSDGDDDSDDDDAEVERLRRENAELRRKTRRAEQAERRRKRQQQEQDGEFEQQAKDEKTRADKAETRLKTSARDQAIVRIATRLRYKDPQITVRLIASELPADVVELDDELAPDVDETTIERALKKLAKESTLDLVNDPDKPQDRGDRVGQGERRTRRTGAADTNGGGDGYVFDPGSKLRSGYATRR